MIQGGFVGQARKFFLDERAQFSAYNKEDLNVLEQVDDHSKLALAEVSKFLTTKFSVKLSLYGFQLLIHFVKLNQFVLLLRILNNSINFQLTQEKNKVELRGAFNVLISEDVHEVN